MLCKKIFVIHLWTHVCDWLAPLYTHSKTPCLLIALIPVFCLIFCATPFLFLLTLPNWWACLGMDRVVSCRFLKDIFGLSIEGFVIILKMIQCIKLFSEFFNFSGPTHISQYWNKILRNMSLHNIISAKQIRKNLSACVNYHFNLFPCVLNYQVRTLVGT